MNKILYIWVELRNCFHLLQHRFAPMHFLIYLVASLASLALTGASPAPSPEAAPQVHCDLVGIKCVCLIPSLDHSTACTDKELKWGLCKNVEYSPC
ncbi:hypothetical protein SISNIDRAFT_356171 [Sistotremastrum niveocremeum HHB9708]|uniref:Uncharacterized protein n=2 Tax=Sistotremastraceae TaxID=3402574 RepID=A0A164WIF0_9AGAM|nr:hypothetical protein SISNIDRAFT_356171 [Sistotremastrum niveocremeum HHB9708]KZT34126.1 hypothetical protein SISSUDRAFT_313371 [Sistotremastrum suecicum HHB10207 ss-3]